MEEDSAYRNGQQEKRGAAYKNQQAMEGGRTGSMHDSTGAYNFDR